MKFPTITTVAFASLHLGNAAPTSFDLLKRTELPSVHNVEYALSSIQGLITNAINPLASSSTAKSTRSIADDDLASINTLFSEMHLVANGTTPLPDMPFAHLTKRAFDPGFGPLADFVDWLRKLLSPLPGQLKTKRGVKVESGAPSKSVSGLIDQLHGWANGTLPIPSPAEGENLAVTAAECLPNLVYLKDAVTAWRYQFEKTSGGKQSDAADQKGVDVDSPVQAIAVRRNSPLSVHMGELEKKDITMEDVNNVLDIIVRVLEVAALVAALL